MINYHELNIGDLVNAEYGGQIKEGEVINLNGDEKQVCVESGDQEFWFEAEHIFPIPLSDEQMSALDFSKEIHEDGSVKFSRDSFRLIIKADNDFTFLEMWYREDMRVHPDVHYVHQLQNQYLQMTKVPLSKKISEY